MKILTPRLVAIAIGMIVFCAGSVTAQPLPRLEPIVVQVAEIDPVGVSVRSKLLDDRSNLTLPETEQPVVLSFYFIQRSQQEVFEAVQDGVRSKRPVHVMDGPRIIGKGNMVGLATFQSNANLVSPGFLLSFDSPEETERVAKEIGEDVEDMIDRIVQDRSRWRL